MDKLLPPAVIGWRWASVPRRKDGTRIGKDEGRPAGMSGRQWKRLRKATRRLALMDIATPRPMGTRNECMRRIQGAYKQRHITPASPFRPNRAPWRRPSPKPWFNTPRAESEALRQFAEAIDVPVPFGASR
jgi:hypothetical protein